jgi:hypothetical protein
MPPRKRPRRIGSDDSEEAGISPLTAAELLQQEDEGVTNAVVAALENLNNNTEKAYKAKWRDWNEWGSEKGYAVDERRGVTVTGPRLNLFLHEWLSKQVVNSGPRSGQPFSFSYQEQYVNAIKKLYEIQVSFWHPCFLLSNWVFISIGRFWDQQQSRSKNCSCKTVPQESSRCPL